MKKSAWPADGNSSGSAFEAVAGPGVAFACDRWVER